MLKKWKFPFYFWHMPNIFGICHLRSGEQSPLHATESPHPALKPSKQYNVAGYALSAALRALRIVMTVLLTL
jgi:hypothetical protein